MNEGIAAGALLELWERALDRPEAARADALLDGDGHDVASLGERNARLAALHTRWFGPAIALVSTCPTCAEVVAFDGDCDAIADEAGAPVAASGRLDHDGHAIAFRLPRVADVAACGGHADDVSFARALLARCVTSCTRDEMAIAADTLPSSVLDALSRRLDALDPGAAISFGLACPRCATHWDAALDIGELVWQRVRAAAERLLLDVDLLARTYGWTEAEVVGLNATRRAAYVQMAAA